MRLLVALSLLCALLNASCELKGPFKSDDPVLASVHGMKLYMSEVVPQITPGSSPQDSVSQVRGIVQSWVREAVLIREAELQLEPDINLNDLINDYRNSLLISNYEKTVVETQIDTVISQAELQDYYQRNKEQYQLERTIVRGHFVKIAQDVDSLEEFRRWWDSGDSLDFVRLFNFSALNADVFLLEDSTWYTVSDIEAIMPAGTMQSQNMKPNTSLRLTDGDYEYYLRIAESVSSREIAPLSYIRAQAVRFIMHKRKLELLERIKSDLYQKALEGDNVKIFTE